MVTSSEKTEAKQQAGGKDSKVKKLKKKGVGYAAGVGEQWDLDAYLKDKGAKNKQVIKLVDIMQTLALVCQGERSEEEGEAEAPLLTLEDEKKIKELFLESSLLPSVEAALRAGSILEMSKELDLYLTYLSLIEAFAQKKSLIGLLLDIDEVYEPKQRESVCKLLSTAATMANVFLDCMDPEQDGETKLKRTKSVEEKEKEINKPK